MVGIWVATGADDHFWPVWPALGMLPGVVAHFAAVRHAGDPARSPFARAGAAWTPFGCATKQVDRTRATAA